MATPASLATASSCYCFDAVTSDKVTIFLLASIAGLTDMTPSELASASACYCFDRATSEKVKAYLLDYIATNGTGGGGGVTCADYGGGEPSFTPTTSCAVAIDTSNERIWWFYSAAWH